MEVDITEIKMYKTHAFTISSMISNWTPMTSYFHGDMPCRGRGEEGTNLDLYILVRHHGPWLGGNDSWPPMRRLWVPFPMPAWCSPS
jgi:hypothetical protein